MSIAVGPLVTFPTTTAPEQRLVCFHHAGGSASAFRAWRHWLPDRTELVAFQLPGREGRMREPFLASVESAADEAAEALERLEPLPWRAFGHSLGGAIAYETAVRARVQPRALIVAATRAPHRPGARLDELDDQTLLRELAAMAGTPRAVLEDQAAMSLFLPRIRADFRMAATYGGAPSRAPLAQLWCLFSADDQIVSPDAACDWDAYASGGARPRELGGDHFFVHKHDPDFIATILEIVGDERLVALL